MSPSHVYCDDCHIIVKRENERRRYWNNLEKGRSKNREYMRKKRKDDPTKALIYLKEWRIRNPEKVRGARQRTSLKVRKLVLLAQSAIKDGLIPRKYLENFL